MTLDGEILDEDSFEYEGPVASCDGSDGDGGYGGLGVGGKSSSGSSNSPYSGMNPDSTAYGGVGTPSEQASAAAAAAGRSSRGDSGRDSAYSGMNPDSTAYGGVGTPAEQASAAKAAQAQMGDSGTSRVSTGLAPNQTMAPGQTINNQPAPGTTAALGAKGQLPESYSSAGFAAHAANMAAARDAWGEIDAKRAAGIDTNVLSFDSVLSAPGALMDSIVGGFTDLGNYVSGFFSDDDETSFSNYDTRMGFLEQEKAYGSLTQNIDAALAKDSLTDMEKLGLQMQIKDYMDTYKHDLPAPTQGFLTDQYNNAGLLDSIGATVGSLIGKTTGAPGYAPLSPAAAAGSFFDFVGTNVLGAAGTALGGPVGGLIGAGLGTALGSAVKSDVRSTMAAQDAMDNLGLGSVNTAPSSGEISAGNDAQGGGGNRETTNVINTQKVTTPTQANPNTNTDTGLVDTDAPGDLPTDDLLEAAWQRWLAYQKSLGNNFNTNFFRGGPYAIQKQGLGSQGRNPDSFLIF
jgi:hypothetical protein